MEDSRSSILSGQQTTVMQAQAELIDLLTQYYTAYYRDTLGLPDWEVRVRNRLQEESLFAEPTITKVEQWLNYDFSGQRVLVVGTGTGAECIALARQCADVYGIEPNDQALHILHLKARLHSIPTDTFLQAYAESIPFSDNSFDFIYCWMVLEHVRNVEKALDEMIRTCKVEGYIFIGTADYRFPYEGHYKLPLIPFAPKWVQRLYLRLRGRPTEFLSSINFVTAPALDRLLWKRNVTSMRVFEPHLFMWRGKRNFFRWFCQTFATHKAQFIFLRKRSL